jgi:hypothetical protein
MSDPGYVALVHAEIDGELDPGQRAELARRLLTDSEARALREDLLQLRKMFDSVGEVEPPTRLRATVLQSLPPFSPPRSSLRWPAQHWRYAALAAGVLGAATLVYETVDGPGPGSAEVAGTIAAKRAPVTVDTVTLGRGPVTGHVSLYRDAGGLGLALELAASEPVDVLIAGDGRTLRVNGLGRTGSAEQKTMVALPGFGLDGKGRVNLTFLISGREVAHATLTATKDN